MDPDNRVIKRLWCISRYFFSYFSKKTYAVGTHEKHLRKVLLMSTYDEYLECIFCGEIGKIPEFLAEKKLSGTL